MQKRYKFCLMALLCPSLIIQAFSSPSKTKQNKINPDPPIRELSVGDVVPSDIVFNNIINYKSSSAKLSDFKGKLVILDFWNTGCSPCIAALPKMSSLQEHFSDNIQIIAIAPEKEAAVARLLNKRWPGSMALRLPFIVADTILAKIFHYGTVPHEVWIKDNKIIAITDDKPVTEMNINHILSGRPANMTMKFRFDFYPISQPLLTDQNNPNIKNLLYQSIITRRCENVKGTGSGFLNTDSTSYRYYRYAYPIKKLYLTAFDAEGKLGEADNRVVLENVKDSSRYIPPNKNNIESFTKWQKNNLFNYELILPVENGNEKLNDRIHRIMQRDLNNFFSDLYGVQGSVEKRVVPCLVIKLHPSFKPSADKQDYYLLGNDTRVWKGQSLTRILKDIAWLSSRVNNGKSPVVIDETNYSGNASIQLDGSAMQNIEAFKKALYDYGLDVQEAEREMDVIVLKENH